MTVDAPSVPRSREERIERLSAASLRRIIDPDIDLQGAPRGGQILPRELISIAALDVELTDEQWAKISREEIASILDAGVRFESVLMAGFGMKLAYEADLTNATTTYILHEVGEETRHSRLFVRSIAHLAPTAKNPFRHWAFELVDRFMVSFLIRREALLCVLILTGEEGPDLIQKRWADHPDTDPFVRECSKYHRLEEARHLAFGRMFLPEAWAKASRLERFVIRHFAPAMMAGAFDSLVHPGVYRSIGLPGWRTWNAVRVSESRKQMRAEAFRPILAAMTDTGVFGKRGRVPRAWRRACLI